MFDDYSKALLHNGMLEAKAGNVELARHYLERAIYACDNSNHPMMAECWFWMSQVTSDPAEKRKALENALSHDFRHIGARRALAILDGKLKPEEIVDPDHLPPAPQDLQKADARRFMCPKCGGRMVFMPDGQSLLCEYCQRSERLGDRVNRANEKDFLVAMATARGHARPLNEQVFHCQGCGAEFILPDKQISVTCGYCGSPHVVNVEKSKDLLAPDGIIPHAFAQTRAAELLSDWMAANRIKPDGQVDLPRGLYLPLWTFDVGGAIDYSGEQVIEVAADEYLHIPATVHSIHDQFPVMINALPIPASRKLSAIFIQLIPTFDLQSVSPYDPRYLSDWPAELYDVPMADASLEARSRAYARLQNDLPHLLGSVKITHTSSANIVIESFKLVLLPVWMNEIFYDGRLHLVLINGQSGIVKGEGHA
jgi:predicted RNA-binding Zn-ribbon protein involved in translation (DUF1610 family)